MALPPKPEYNLYEAIEAQLRKWKRDPSIEQVVLVYGLRPYPWAELRPNGQTGDALQIPLPSMPNPFPTWVEFFRRHIESAVMTVAGDCQMRAYILGSRGGLTELVRTYPETL